MSRGGGGECPRFIFLHYVWCVLISNIRAIYPFKALSVYA